MVATKRERAVREVTKAAVKEVTGCGRVEDVKVDFQISRLGV